MTAARAWSALLAVIPAFAQTAYKAPRTWDNKPDIQGIWQVQNTANFDLEPHTASLGMPAGAGVIVDPPDGKIPYLPAALAQRKQNFENRAIADPVAKCYMPGVPRLTYLPFPLQVFQTPKFVIVASEYIHNYRTIHLDGRPHLDGVDFYNGDSRGHWEGDTLVVDVAGFNDQTWFDRAGNYHSDALHVVERYTRTGPDTLLYEATIEDPKVFARPWKISMALARRTEKNLRLLEYECYAYLEDAAKEAKEKK
jgi:hypothetical protein